MKNLKKVLALVLAFACAFTMFAGAAFTDQADIKVADEVVDTLTELGIIEGFEDGSFQPDATVTRAQMAKMIYVLRTGNSDASAYNNDKTSFTDIGTHWARGYIKYCQSVGIIAGKSSTIFAPNATVTAQEAAKMLLVTLGYDAQKAGLVGTSWAAKTNALADENGLLEDVNTSFTGPCPRQYAAQLIYNAIDAPTVVWRDDAYTTNNYGNGDNPTIGEKYMGLHSVEGILTYFQKEDGKDTYNATVSSITKKDGTALSGKDIIDEQNFSKIAKDYYALKHQKVKVLYKETDKVYGVFALTDSNTVLTGVVGDFGEDSGKLKYDGKKYTLAAKNSVYVNDEDAKATSVADYADKATGIVKAYDATAISNDDSSKISRLDVASFAVGQVTYVGSDYINVSYKANNVAGVNGKTNFSTKLESDDVTYPSDIKKDDYVAVTAAVNTSDGNIGVTKLDVVTGKITTTKKASTDDAYEITIGGTTYEKAGVADDKAKDLKLNATVAVVVKGNYFLYVDDANAEAKDIGMMTEVYKSGNRFKATIVKADGSSETVTIKKTDGYYQNGKAVSTIPEFDSAKKGAGVAAKLVSYTKSGDEYKIKELDSSKEKAGYDVYTVSSDTSVKNKRFTSGTVSAIEDNATVFVRYKTDSYKVITGKDLKNWKDTVTFDATILADTSNSVNYAKVVLADLADDSMAGGSDVNYGYVYTKESGTNADEDEYNVYYVWNGSETVELWTDDTADISTGNVIEYSIDGTIETANGTKTEITVDNVYGGSTNKWTKVAVTGGDYGTDKTGTVYYVEDKDGDKLVSTAETPVALTVDTDDDAIILFVDTSDDGKKDAGTQLSDNMDLSSYIQDNGDGTYKVNAVIYKGAKDKNIVVIDTTGELSKKVK